MDSIRLSRMLPGALVVLCVTSLSCRHRPCQVASGLTEEGLQKVVHAMPEDEVRLALGAPLTEYKQGDGSTALLYATHGGWKVAGVSRTVTSEGIYCLVILRDGLVSRATLFKPDGETSCTCTLESCPDGWAAPCAGPIARCAARDEGPE